jgi:hypothetical protein
VIENPYHASIKDNSIYSHIEKFSKKKHNDSIKLKKGIYYEMLETVFSLGESTRILLSKSLIKELSIQDYLYSFSLQNQNAGCFSLFNQKKGCLYQTDFFEFSIIQLAEIQKGRTNYSQILENKLLLDDNDHFEILCNKKSNIKKQINRENSHSLINNHKQDDARRVNGLHSNQSTQETLQTLSQNKLFKNKSASLKEDDLMEKQINNQSRREENLSTLEINEEKPSQENGRGIHSPKYELIGKKRNSLQNGENEVKKILLSETIIKNSEKLKKIKKKIKIIDNLKISTSTEDFDILIADRIENNEQFSNALQQV